MRGKLVNGRSPAVVRRVWLALPLTHLRDKMPSLNVVRSRRGARVDESTCLESMRPGNGTVGSNPTLSAILVCLTSGRSRKNVAAESAVDGDRGRALCNRTL